MEGRVAKGEEGVVVAKRKEEKGVGGEKEEEPRKKERKRERKEGRKEGRKKETLQGRGVRIRRNGM